MVSSQFLTTPSFMLPIKFSGKTCDNNMFTLLFIFARFGKIYPCAEWFLFSPQILSVQLVDEQTAAQLRLKPGGFRRHQPPRVRHGKELLNRCGIHGKGAAVGMGALFCGVTNAPITSLLLCLELFGMDAAARRGSASTPGSADKCRRPDRRWETSTGRCVP